MNTKELIQKQMEEIYLSGKYKIVDLSLIENIKNLEVSKEVLEVQKYFLESYREYLENIKTLPEELQPLFLKALKHDEIVANHTLEKVNPFTISMYMLAKSKPALDKLLEKKEPLDSLDFQKIHQRLLDKTTSSENDLEYRMENTTFVGSFYKGERQIEYLPIDYKFIPEAVERLLEIYNQNDDDMELAFLKPLKIHGLVAGLQIFKDGNTRFARMLQYVSLYNSTMRYIDKNLPSPALYASKTYYPMREKYRTLIRELVLNNDPENWNKWFIFNYHRFEEQIMVNEENIKSLKMIL